MEDFAQKIIEIIRKNFPNGVRADFIDANKIARLYAANYHEEISRAQILEIICKSGIENGGRFYFISENDVEMILTALSAIFENYSPIYYSALYEKHADFFARFKIFSADILKNFLRESKDDNFYFEEYCAADESTRLETELEKIFAAAENPLTLETLQEKFLYVPPKKILEIISDTKKYLPTTGGGYISISKLQFDAAEINAAKNQLLQFLSKNEYATFENCDLSSNFALNPEVVEKNLREVIFEKFLSAELDKRGNRLFKKGNKNNGGNFMTDLRKFIAARQEISAEELFKFAESLGVVKTDKHISLTAANETMIRVEKNFFVKDALINFDVAGIDAALNSFVQDKIISLRGVNSFTGFPAVEGYSWNLFLLESFLRRFSKKYSFMAAGANVNSSSIGAIFPKSMKFADYLELQIAVIVQEKIPLESSAVENFLINQGYREKRIKKVTDRIIDGARKLQ